MFDRFTNLSKRAKVHLTAIGLFAAFAVLVALLITFKATAGLILGVLLMLLIFGGFTALVYIICFMIASEIFNYDF